MEPARSYVICCVQRAGSWLLAHTLADTGYAGRPSDYFDEEERKTHTREWGLASGDLAPYIQAVRDRATTPNGVLGSKLMWNDFDWLRSAIPPTAGTDAGREFMRMAFGDPQFVWLRRQDKVRQGISWWRASVTGQWGLQPDQEAGQPAPEVERILPLVRFAQQCEDGWRQWFASAGIQPCEVVYEDLAQDRLTVLGQVLGQDRLTVANRVLSFLSLPLIDAGRLPPVRYRRQADGLTERYADLVRAAIDEAQPPVS